MVAKAFDLEDVRDVHRDLECKERALVSKAARRYQAWASRSYEEPGVAVCSGYVPTMRQTWEGRRGHELHGS